MDIINEVKHLFDVDSFSSFSERVTMVNLDFDFSPHGTPLIEKFDAFFKMLPHRDVATIQLSIDGGDSVQISSDKALPFEAINDAICDVDDVSVATVKVEIKKSVENNLFSIYSFESFSDDFLALSIEEVMSSFSLLLKGQDHLTFQLFSGGSFFATETMVFTPDQGSDIKTPFARIKRLEECRTVSNFYNKANYELLPDDFSIKLSFTDNPFADAFRKICSLLSLAYISNSAYLENGKLTSQIIGQRKVEYSYSISDTAANSEFYKIYKWIFTDGNAVDKAILARNIISLHCRYASLGEIDEKTLSSIQSNYNIYLKENVSQYIELKNKVAEFICDVITKIGDYTIAQLSGLKNNLIAIFGFLLTVMLANIVSEQTLENIFTKDITIILELVLAGSFVYLVICYGETRYKLNKAIKSYQLLKNNYSVLLSDEDMREAFNNDRQIEQSTKTAFCGIRLLTIFWLVILIIFLVVLENISNNPIISPWLSTLIHYVNTK